MKRFLLVFAVFLLSLSIVSAYDGISIEEVDSKTIIEPEEIGTYTLKITNLGSKSYQLQIDGDIYAGLPSSDFQHVLVSPNYVDLEGRDSVEIEVEILLQEDVPRQTRYKTHVDIVSLNNDDVNERYTLQVFAQQPEDPIAVYIVDAPESIAPNQDFVLTLGLSNNLEKDLSNVDVKVSSDFFEDEQTVQLFDDQEREVEFTFPIDYSAAPGSYSFNARVFYEGDLMSAVSGLYTVEESSAVKETVVTTDGLLFSEVAVTKENTGNTVAADSYDYDFGLIQGWFIKYNLAPSEESSRSSYWAFNIDPGEEYLITITIDYRPALIGLLVILAALVVGYFVFSRRVTIKKDVFKLKYSTQGLSDFKVMLHVKNKTSKPIKDIVVVDRLPKIIKPTLQFGTIRPVGMQRGEKGVRMKWTISELVSGEERIISYEVMPRMSVIGRLTLPPALAKYKSKTKRVHRVRSNRPHVYSGVADEGQKKKRKKKR